MSQTIAQQALDILTPIPVDHFITGKYSGNDGYNGQFHCAMGFFNLAVNKNDHPTYAVHSDVEFVLRKASREFIRSKGILGSADIIVVNDRPVGEYNESNPKDRVIHLLNDMIAAGL